MFGKNFLFLVGIVVVVAVLSTCDARYIKHKKHQKHHETGSKKNRIRYVQMRPGKKQMLGGVPAGCCASAQAGYSTEDPNACCQSASPPPCCQQSVPFQPQMPPSQPFMPSQECCSQAGAPMAGQVGVPMMGQTGASMMGQSPFSCCQSASPPPCCQQSAQIPPQMPPPQPIMPSQGCCSQSGAPMMPGQSPYSCCQSSSPPPCCNQPMTAPQPPPMTMVNAGCCSSAPSPPDNNGIYLGLAHPDQQCCQAPNPPPCCFGLHLKPGQSKNISMNGGGKNYVLSVKLSNATNITDNATSNPCNIPTCTPPTSNPTSAASNAPTAAPTGSSNATSGPTKSSSASSAAPSETSGSTTPSASTTSGPSTGGNNPCQTKALNEHNAKRSIHNSPPMTLDPQLNAAAQAYAETLASSKKVEHSPQNERQGQGENLAKRCSKPDTGFDCKAATDMWYDEVKKYDWGSPGYSGLTGHFTQVVWKDSTKLGIGKASFVNDAGMTCWVVVGRYKPAGNVKGQFPENVQKGSYTGRRSQLVNA